MDAARASPRRTWIGLGILAAFVAALTWTLRDGAAPARSLSAPDAATSPVARAPADAGAREADLPAEPAASNPTTLARSGRADEEGATLERARPLRGRVVDEEGAGLAGARIVFRRARERGPSAEATLERSALSGPGGDFAVEDFPPELAAGPPHVRLERHVLVRASEYRRDERGDWEPLELVLAPSATLEVLVLDELGAPALDRLVAALPLAEELLALDRRVVSWKAAALEAGRVVGADGLARFELPARRRLGVLVQGGGEDDSFERCEGNVLSIDTDAAPLVLAPGELRRVLRVPGATLRLEGVVLHPDRSPAPEARVRVLGGEPEENGWSEYVDEARTDARGRFSFELRGLEHEEALTLIASDGEWIAIVGEPARGATRKRVEVASLLERPVPIELVLEPLLSISGSVLDEAGAPVSAYVWAVPPGSAYVLEKGALGFLPISRGTTPEGAFEVPALRPGPHDLIVKRNRPRTYHRFPGLEAGARELVLVVEDDRVVRIRLVADGARAGDRLHSVLLWHQWRDADACGAPAASAKVVVEGCDEARWPRLPPGELRTHAASVEHAGGRTLVLIEGPSDAAERELEPRQAGCYSVGLRGWDAEGRPYARKLSPPLRLEAGETLFALRLELAASVEGRVREPAEDLHVELRDARGALVHGAPGEVRVALTAAGSFRLEELPPGELELRIGTLAELESGGWRLREALRLGPGESAAVELD